jgi:outer membrane protein TolC
LRKERAGLKLAKLKIQDTQLSLQFERKSLENKLKSQQQEIISLQKQQAYNAELVQNYNQLLTAEDRLFGMGESSLFLINSRENTLVSAQLNAIGLENRYFQALLGLYKTMAQPQ